MSYMLSGLARDAQLKVPFIYPGSGSGLLNLNLRFRYILNTPITWPLTANYTLVSFIIMVFRCMFLLLQIICRYCL